MSHMCEEVFFDDCDIAFRQATLRFKVSISTLILIAQNTEHMSHGVHT